MAGPTISGPGSNIDTQKIVASLVAAEKAPKQTAINDQTLKATTQLSSIGKIQAALTPSVAPSTTCPRTPVSVACPRHLRMKRLPR